MNVLVTGANGQLGNEMRIVAADSAAGCSFIFTDIFPETEESLATLQRLAPRAVQDTVILDITDAAAVKEAVREFNVDCIVNCAAYTNVDAAESDAQAALKLNAEAPAILAGVMRETGGLLIHISTDYVFGGDVYNTPCTEDRKGTPTGVYGSTKLQGEERIKASGCSSVILRTSWLYSEFGRNFCRTMLNLTATRAQLNVVFDQVGTPTYARDLAEAVMAVLKAPQCGIYNFSNEGVCSWYDFARAIQSIGNELREAQGVPVSRCSVKPCHSSEFPSPVRRPAYSVLDKTKIKSAFALEISHWTESLRRCINNIEL